MNNAITVILVIIALGIQPWLAEWASHGSLWPFVVGFITLVAPGGWWIWNNEREKQ